MYLVYQTETDWKLQNIYKQCEAQLLYAMSWRSSKRNLYVFITYTILLFYLTQWYYVVNKDFSIVIWS